MAFLILGENKTRENSALVTFLSRKLRHSCSFRDRNYCSIYESFESCQYSPSFEIGLAIAAVQGFTRRISLAEHEISGILQRLEGSRHLYATNSENGVPIRLALFDVPFLLLAPET